jgi:hypothetical protein
MNDEVLTLSLRISCENIKSENPSFIGKRQRRLNHPEELKRFNTFLVEWGEI